MSSTIFQRLSQRAAIQTNSQQVSIVVSTIGMTSTIFISPPLLRKRDSGLTESTGNFTILEFSQFPLCRKLPLNKRCCKNSKRNFFQRPGLVVRYQYGRRSSQREKTELHRQKKTGIFYASLTSHYLHSGDRKSSGSFGSSGTKLEPLKISVMFYDTGIL